MWINKPWLFDNVRLMYIYFQSSDYQLDFARKVAEALMGLIRKNIIKMVIKFINCDGLLCFCDGVVTDLEPELF